MEAVTRRTCPVIQTLNRCGCCDRDTLCRRGCGDRAAIMLTMITTCRLNDVDPKAWLADVLDVLARIADLPTSRLHERLPWEWKLLRQAGNSDD